LWTWFTRTTTDFLSSPGWSIILLVVLVSLTLLSTKFRQRYRRFKIWGIAIATSTLCFSLFLPPIGHQLLVGFLPPDSGEAAEAIVILGRGTELQPQRVTVATHLFRAGRAPQIFVSGFGDAPLIVQQLQQRNIPTAALSSESCSRTTAENAEFTAAHLQPQDIHKIILVTDPPHMLRSMLTFRGVGFEVIPHASPLPAKYDTQKARFLALRESLGFISYGLLGRYQMKSPSQTFMSSGLTEYR
jgi:uncharacterized SAM-binding protein YcdF (DUF218 family)